MSIINPLFVRQICVLSRLHTDGYKSVAIQVGYASSNLGSVYHGRRKMPDDIAEQISDVLHFKPAGFTNDGAIESAIARDVQSVLDLVECGFDVKLLCRLTSDRERKFPDKVLYKFGLVLISYNNTHRLLVLRMTRDGMDELWSKRSLRAKSATANQTEFDYNQFGALMRLNLEASRDQLPASHIDLSVQQVSTLVEKIYASFHSTSGAATLTAAREASAILSLDRKRRHRNYVSIAKEIYGLASSREVSKGTGRSSAWESVPVEIHVIFKEDHDEKVMCATDEFEHLIILREYHDGVIEILYEGPRCLITEIVESNDVRKSITLTPDEFRDFNLKVERRSRLIKPVA